MRIPTFETPEPGAWQTDESGRRFRMIGDVKEYEMMVSVDGIQVPQSELAAYYERKRAAEEAQREAERNRPAPPPPKNCPFRDGLTTACTGEACALYLKGCTLARLVNRPPAKHTEGLQCPFSKYASKCRTDCALYKETGCTLTAVENESEVN